MDLLEPVSQHKQITTQDKNLKWHKFLHWFAIAAIAIVVLAPIIPLFFWSFAYGWRFPDLLPEQFSMRAWNYVFSDASGVPNAMLNSFKIAVVATGLSILIGLPAGRAMGLYKFRGKGILEFLILAPPIVPTLAVAMGIHVAFIKYGLSDTLIGVILVHLIPITPYMVMVLSSVFSNYEVEYEEQARVLGAGPIATLFYVTLPAIFPGMMVGALFAFIISWAQYVLTILIGGGDVKTLPVILFAFATSGDNAITAALAVVFIGPAVLFLVLTSKFLTGQSAALGGFGRL